MIAQVVLLGSLMAVANAGLLLGHHHGIGGGLGGGVGGGVGGGHGHGHVVDLYAPPHYEYRYAVHDPHTHDVKEQAEWRVGDKTKSELAWGEHDRHAAVSRVIHNTGTLVLHGHHGHGYGK